ncbi:MAG: MAPEG family protein [Xanthobacteraceae bacterium]
MSCLSPPALRPVAAERICRALPANAENDTENIPLFLVAGPLCVCTTPSDVMALGLFSPYVLSRLAHLRVVLRRDHTRSALRFEPLARSSSISRLALSLLTHGAICGQEPERHGATRSVRKIAAMTAPAPFPPFHAVQYECVVEDAVLREPVSTANSVLTGKNTGKFHKTPESVHYSLPKLIVKSAISAKFPMPTNRECLAA